MMNVSMQPALYSISALSVELNRDRRTIALTALPTNRVDESLTLLILRAR
jgi:hypothetical protein